MNTLHELNQKIWYRVVKVLYIGSFIIFLLLSIGLIYENSSTYPYNEKKTRITCVQVKIAEEINKSSYGIEDTLSTDQKRRIAADICGANPNTADLEEKGGRLNTLLSDNEIFKASQGVMEDGIDVANFVFHTLIFAVVLSVLYEIARRVFYYIFFGTFRPLKKKELSGH